MAKKPPRDDKKPPALTIVGDIKDPSKGGAPGKANEETLKMIVATLRLGAHMDIACLMAELDPKTLRSYIIRGRDEPGTIYEKFLEQINKALAEAEIRDLGVIDMAAQGRPAQFQMVPMVNPVTGDVVIGPDGKVVMQVQLDGEGKPVKIRNEVFPSWQASAWKLERKAPKRWGRYDRVQIDDMEALNKDEAKKTEEEKIDQGQIEARAKRLKRVMTVLDAVAEDTDLADV